MKNNYIIFFDFDNTITQFDIMNDMLLRFSKDDKWLELEKKWQNQEMGPEGCIKGQLAGIRITKVLLDRYLSRIGIDPYFKKLIKIFKSKKIKTIILSDNFDYIVNLILRNNNVPKLQVYANKLRIVKDRLIPKFSFMSRGHKYCENGKKRLLLANKDKGLISVYVGDGLSDLCAAKEADIIFAKSSLAKYLDKEGLRHIPIEGLKDVYYYFKRKLL